MTMWHIKRSSNFNVQLTDVFIFTVGKVLRRHCGGYAQSLCCRIPASSVVRSDLLTFKEWRNISNAFHSSKIIVLSC